MVAVGLCIWLDSTLLYRFYQNRFKNLLGLSYFNIFPVVVKSYVCMLKKKPDPSRDGALRWSLSYDELCYCQAVVAPRSQKTCQGKYDATACPDVLTCNLWFVDDPTPLTKRQNWNKEVLDRLLQRVDHCG